MKLKIRYDEAYQVLDLDEQATEQLWVSLDLDGGEALSQEEREKRIDIRYLPFSSRNHDVAFTKIADDRHFHPVRDYLDSLPTWDGVKRVENLFIKYLKADDTDYVRAVTRKTFTAAVARIYVPGIKFDCVSSFKSWQAKRFKSLLKVRPQVKRIVGLTGTPSSNGLIDLWAQFRLLDLGKRLGRYITHYRNAYFTPDKRNGEVVFSYKPLPGAEERIYEQISDITISMKSCDYLKLPECVINAVPVYMNEQEQAVYDTFKEDMVAKIKGTEIDAANAAVLSGKLLQMANGAVYDEDKNSHYIHDRKLDALEDLMEGANGKPVLIAYWYQQDAERIKARFPVREIKTSKDIDDWNAGRISAAIIHPASAGHGLNLQSGGSTLIWFGLTWSLELYQQTNARLHRQGQKNTVIIHHIITAGTIDEDVMKALRKKKRTQNALIDAVKANLGASL